MAAYLSELGLPTLFALTKVDKLTAGKRQAHIDRVIQKLGIDQEQALPFSAVTGEGRDELLSSVEDLLQG